MANFDLSKLSGALLRSDGESSLGSSRRRDFSDSFSGFNGSAIISDRNVLEHTQSLEQQLQIQTAQLDPTTTLQRYLKSGAIISTASSFARAFQEATDWNATTFQKIGAGSCGRIFEHPGTTIVYKVANTDDPSKLWNNYVAQVKVADTWDRLGDAAGACEVPRAHWYAEPSCTVFWDGHLEKFEYDKDFKQQPRHVMCIERILSVPKPIREALIAKWCPPQFQEQMRKDPKNNVCLIRVYLGRRRRTSTSRYFALHNFALHLDQAIELKLDLDPMVESMAHALAVLHWEVLLDGTDVEFVIGTAPQDVGRLARRITTQPLQLEQSPHSTFEEVAAVRQDFTRRVTSLWMLDFDLCGPMKLDFASVQRAVKAFFQNDPYYPRPPTSNNNDQTVRKLWTMFRQEYLEKSLEILKKQGRASAVAELPKTFIEQVEIRAEKQVVGSSSVMQTGSGNQYGRIQPRTQRAVGALHASSSAPAGFTNVARGSDVARGGHIARGDHVARGGHVERGDHVAQRVHSGQNDEHRGGAGGRRGRGGRAGNRGSQSSRRGPFGSDNWRSG